MSQSCKLPRPTGLPVRVGARRSMASAPVTVTSTTMVPPLASRRGSLSRPLKATLRLPGLARDAKSVQDLAGLAGETTCVRKTASFHCLKPIIFETKRKLEIVEALDSPGASRPKVAATTLDEEQMPDSTYSKYLANSVVADCEKVLQTLHAKAARNSSEFDDSVASFLSEQADLLDVHLDISVVSGTSDAVDRTPSVEDLPMECEVVTPGAATMSLDTGYQGDGELSRPESRNAESEVLLLKVQDDMKTMTDSDFFTESDADGHDDLLGKKGDRKAQVIDGTLYGGPSERSQAEDMESSGIYSDLERKPDPPAYHELISQQIRTIQSIVLCHKETTIAETGMVKSSSGDSSSTIQETPTVKVSPTEPMKKDVIPKNKMPNRNVESKVKTLITSETKPESKVRTLKRGKWDAVMDKIAAGRDKQPPVSKFRDVKSKVYQAVQSTRGSSGGATPPLDAGKTRSRRSTRVRSSESSLVSPKSKQSRTSVNSSPHSSISDLSLSSCNPATVQRNNKKRDGPCAPAARDHLANTAARLSPRLRDSHVGVTKGPVTNGNSNMKGSVGRRPNTPRSLHPPLKDVNQNGVVTKSTSTNSINGTPPNINNNNNMNYKAKVVGRLGKSQSMVRPGIPRAPKETTPVLKKHLAESHRAVEALAALINYCAVDLDAFKTPYLKRELETARWKLETSEENLHRARASCCQLEEQLQLAHTTVTELKSGETTMRSALEVEQERVLTVQKHLDDARSDCCRLEEEAQVARETIKLLRVNEEHFKEKIQALNELTVQFDKVLNLKRESDESLRESKQQISTLVEHLEDKEREVKMLMGDNIKLRDKISGLSGKNNILQVELESLKNIENKYVESPTVADKTVKDRLCSNQRLSSSEWFQEKCGTGPSDCSEQTLLSEVESLRQVLSLKTEELSELRRHELHLRVEADRVPKLLSLVTTLEAKVEDLQSQLSSQLDVVRNLTQINEKLDEELKTESHKKTRLSHKNEELQYKLRVNSEAMWQLVNKNIGDERSAESSSVGNSPRRFDDTRPQMVAVVQKSDSVSYMLDMGEDTAEVVSNIVRRAESVRSQTLPKKKRARTLGSADTPTSEYYSCIDSPGASPSVTPRRPARSRACVRLLHSDFATDSIELPREADCEVIEISRSFDRVEPDMSCSTSSNSSSNFDIESEVYPDSPVMLRYPMESELPEKRLDPEGQDTVAHALSDGTVDDEEDVRPFLTPLVSAGEAMVSSDEDELK